MAKRKILISVLAVVLVLTLALTAFVACNGDKKYTVTFKDGDTVVSTLKDIKAGTKLTAEQIPGAPENIPADKEFGGWYIGEGDDAVKVEAGYEVKGNVTAVAKFKDKTGIVEPVVYSVVFKNGADVVRTVEVEEGVALQATDFPEAPVNGLNFYGWCTVNGTDYQRYNAGDAVNANLELIAQFSKKFYFNITVPIAGEYVATVAEDPAIEVAVVISDEAFIFDGKEVAYTDAVYNSDNGWVWVVEGQKYQFLELDGKLTVIADKTYTLSGGGNEDVEIPAAFHGTWVGVDDFEADWLVNYTIVIDADGVVSSSAPQADLEDITEQEYAVVSYDEAEKKLVVETSGFMKETFWLILKNDGTLQFTDELGWYNISLSKEGGVEEPDTFTVTFKNGDTVVDTLENIVDGTALTAQQIPADPTAPNGQHFVGWYIGEGDDAVKVEAGYEVKGTVIAVAKFENDSVDEPDTYTVTFKNGDVVIDTVEVEEGDSFPIEKLPTAPSVPVGKEFLGWFVGNTKVDKNYIVLGDVDAVAKIETIKVSVKFFNKNGEISDSAITKDYGYVLTEEDLPENPVNGDLTFFGWCEVDGADYYLYRVGDEIREDVELVAQFSNKFTGYVGVYDAVSSNIDATYGLNTIVTVTEDSIAFAGNNVAFDQCIYSDESNGWIFYVGRYRHEFGDDILFGQSVGLSFKVNGYSYSLTAQGENPPAVEIDPSYFGVYEVDGTGYPPMGYPNDEIVISEDGITYINNGYDVTCVAFDLAVREDGGYTFKLNFGTEDYPADDFEAAIYFDGGKLYFKDGYNASELIVPAPPVVIDEEYYGNYAIKDDYYGDGIKITEDGIFYVDGYNKTETKVTDLAARENGGYKFKVTVGSYPVNGEIYFADRTLYFYDGYNAEELVIIVPELPEHARGTWANEDSSVIIVVSEDGRTVTMTTTEDTKSTTEISGSGSDWYFVIDGIEYNIYKSQYSNTMYLYGEGFDERGEQLVSTSITIEFKVNYTIVAEFNLTKGDVFSKVIDVIELPADPTARTNYQFVGWFDEDDSSVEFDDEGVYTENKTFVAKFVRIAYTVTFECEGMQDVEKTINIVEGKATLVAGDIPSYMSVADKVFVGYYTNKLVKAEAGVVIDDDVTFTAAFANQESYVGVWMDSVNKAYANIVSENGSIKLYGLGISNKALTYADGVATLTESGKTYTFNAINGTLLVSVKWWDGIEEDFVTVNYNMTVGTVPSYAGTYQVGKNNYFVIGEGGAVLKAEGANYTANVWSAIVFTSGGYYYDDTYTYEYKSSIDGSVTRFEITFDSNGNLIFNDKIYVKITGETEFADYYYSGFGTLNVFKLDDETVVYTHSASNVYSYVTVEGIVAEGEVFTVTVAEQEYTFKLVNGSLVAPGAELGDYTDENGEHQVSLDGFGGAICDDGNGGTEDYTYYMIGSDKAVIVEADQCIKLLANNQYELVEKDEDLVGKFTVEEPEFSTVRTFEIILDGYGRIAYRNGTNLNNVAYKYDVYTVSGNKINLTSTSLVYTKTITVEQNGEVLIVGSRTYVKEGASFTDHESDFEGYYEGAGDATVKIVASSKTIIYNGTAYTYTKNYNGTELRFEFKDTCCDYATSVNILTLNGDTLTLVHNCARDDGDGGVEWENASKTLTFTAAQEPGSGDAFEGTWTKSSGNVLFVTSLEFDGAGNVKINGGDSVAYNVSGNTATFTYNYEYEFTVTVNGNSLSVDMEYDYTEYSAVFTKYA